MTRLALLPYALGVMHFVVDATTVTVALGASVLHGLSFAEAYALILTYDMLAFATQVFLGAAADRFGAFRALHFAGLVIVAASVLVVPVHAMGAAIVAGIGNALFHVGAGAITLCVSRGRAAPSGVFVAPGALGLALGLFLGRSGLFVAWPFLVSVGACVVGSLLVLRSSSTYVALLPQRGDPSLAPPRVDVASAARHGAVLLLLFSIVIRAAVGHAGSYQCPSGPWTVFALGGAAFAGKALGGHLSDRLGWIKVSVAALLASAPLLAFSDGALAIVAVGMFLFQMTMPVTLTAIFVAYPRRPGFSFGIACLALILGALPTFVPGVAYYYSELSFLGTVLVSAAAVATGLYLLGLREHFALSHRPKLT